MVNKIFITNMKFLFISVYSRPYSGHGFYHQERSFHIEWHGMQKFKSQSGIIYLFKVFLKSVVYKVSYVWTSEVICSKHTFIKLAKPVAHSHKTPVLTCGFIISTSLMS